MIGRTRVLGRGVFAAALLGALGFGATQALASPATAAARTTCSREQFDQCRAECWAQYGRFAQTTCSSGPWGVTCSCGPAIFPTAS